MALDLEDLFKITAVVGVISIMSIMLLLTLPSDNTKSLIQMYMMNIVDDCKKNSFETMTKCINDEISNLGPFYENNYENIPIYIVILDNQDEIIHFHEFSLQDSSSSSNSISNQISKVNSCNYLQTCNYISYQDMNSNYFSLVII